MDQDQLDLSEVKQVVQEHVQPITDFSAESSIGGTPVSTVGILSLFNIFVGLMVATAVILFVSGIVVWMVRLGTLGRTEGIRLMEWGVVILFVLAVLLSIIQYFGSHPAFVSMLIAGAVAIFIAWVAIKVIQGGGGEEEKGPPRPPRA